MILCCGEALIDMLPLRTDAGEEVFAPHVGGAVFNTSIALGRLGANTGLWCGLSDDLFGRRLEGALRESGVSTSLCPRSGRPTTLAFVTLKAGQATYAFYDENTAARMVRVSDLPELADDVSTLFFGGISLVAEPCGSAYEALLMREAKRRLIMIDPNIRPSFIVDEEAYRRRLENMMAKADIIKLSDEDMAWLFPERSEEEVFQELIASDGPSVLLVTRGAAGAICYGPEGRITVPAPEITIGDTVGAGDTFNAGFLAGLGREQALSKAAIATARNATLEKCVELAVTAASMTASRVGANPPWADEILANASPSNT